jgi:hypothetical protein
MPILKSGFGVGYAMWLHLPLSHIRDDRELLHRERPFRHAEVILPFNAILGRPTLYQFMVVAHYGYLVLKMSSPNGVLKIWRDRDAGACALEKLQALAVTREAAAEPGGAKTPCHRAHASAAWHQRPSCNPPPRRISL